MKKHDEHDFMLDRPSSAYVGCCDYQEAYQGKGDIFFGSLRGEFKKYRNDVVKNGEQSVFYGKVLCPERVGRSDGEVEWKYYKNKAFWAGGIDQRRTFVLVSDIKFYMKNGRVDPNKGTCKELLWLFDNGYSFSPASDNVKTIARPDPRKRNFIIRDYSLSNISEYKNAKEKLEKLIVDVVQKRKQNLSRMDHNQLVKRENFSGFSNIIKGKENRQPANLYTIPARRKQGESTVRNTSSTFGSSSRLFSSSNTGVKRKPNVLFPRQPQF